MSRRLCALACVLALALGGCAAPGGAQETRLRELLEGIDRLEGCTTALEELIGEGFSIEISLQNAARCRDELLPAMDALREVADRLEKLCDRAAWPFPTYFDLLHDA